MTDDALLLISDCLDGEPVDPHALARALEDEAARGLACDLLLLRAAANGTGSEERPSDAFYARMQGLLAPSTPRRRPWRPLAAAAAILLAALAGFASRPLLDSEHPPATVVETREPRDEPPANGSAAPMEAPPEPTRVVHFRRGVDWQR